MLAVCSAAPERSMLSIAFSIHAQRASRAPFSFVTEAGAGCVSTSTAQQPPRASSASGRNPETPGGHQ
jgi:hypothetical protein